MKMLFWLIVFILISGNCTAQELLVFAGSGMRAPLEQLGQDFSRETGIGVVFDFDGSGRLGSKILLGIKPDLFIPGSDRWALKLKSEGYVEDCLAIANHTPVIIRPKGNNKVEGLSDLTRKDLKVALGDAKSAAIGRINQRLFKSAVIDPQQVNVVARGINVKQLLSWVETGSVDAAIVWQADAFQSQKVETIAIPAKVNPIDCIPVCLLKKSEHPEAAARFWNFLRTRSQSVFAMHGFNVIEH
jgi:molybdate transport system substrate-binding protein